ncbi:hypothetical protein K227x_32700 [Rubripirellula lacrimiformis]|uniref:Uncharacterized protein n=1 Tax=Rubripirellula lacrimiformis TaxID=1930273 RepID=A0A517NCL1_9BACT|nr:hypothetical protein K227x_32700 [Rubripirellula lacrimiformis]
MVATTQTHTESTEKPAEIFANVNGERFTLSGAAVAKDLRRPFEFRVPKDEKENPYRELQRRGAQNLDDILDVDNQIMVFWFVGIYKWTDEELHLALKYCGQGVEGQHFRDFRPPSSFDDNPTDGEVRLVLKRRKKQANHPMHPNGEIGRFQVDDQSSPPVDR